MFEVCVTVILSTITTLAIKMQYYTKVTHVYLCSDTPLVCIKSEQQRDDVLFVAEH